MTLDLSPSADEDQIEFVTACELNHLGGVQLRLDGIFYLWPGDYIQPLNQGRLFCVDYVEHVEDLFDSFTLARTSMLFGTVPQATVNLNDYFPGYVTVKAGEQRKKDQWHLYKSGTS
jgi:hypothetical protein